MGNSNLMHALSNNTNIGTIRETFFCNQLLEAGHEVYLAKKGDFIVDTKYTFEVGGGSKTFKQIRDVQDSFLAKDNTPIGDVNRIPLWLFGFLY